MGPSKHEIVRNLQILADKEVGRGYDKFEAFINGGLYDNFAAAIQMFGQKRDWIGDIHRGGYQKESRYFSVDLQQPPFLEGGSFIYALSYDNGQPTFGLLLPFNADNKLDRRRVISASSFLEPRVYAFKPNHHQTWNQEVQTASAIIWVTQMASAQLASFIEREWPSTLEETLAVL